MKTIVTSENLEQWIGGEIIVPKEFETLNSFQAPISLVWELTGKCMSNCIYCSGGFPKKTNDMTSEQRMKLADELIAMKIFMISLSGGDPLLCNDLERLVEKFTDAGISTMICSPGLLIDEMQIERLCRNSLVAFNISLDSVNSKINDYQRGREGACDSAKRLISYIDKYGLGKIFTSVEMVITKKNKKEIEPLVQEMINHNVNEIRIQPVVAMNYMTYDKGLALNFEDIDEIQKEIERVTKKYAINNAKEGMLCVRFVHQSKAVIKGMKDKINWGGIISPEGDLMLNGYIPYIYGNLFEYADFQDAWQKGFAKGWKIIQKDETLQNVKNIIDLQKLFKEKGFVKKRYE